jgi:carbon monoxide dehydrogenase subunit G
MAGSMQFGGEETFAAPIERVYQLLTDLDGLPASIPDLASSKRLPDGTLEAVVRPGFSFLRGTMKLKIALDELTPPTNATMRIDGSGIGVSMKVASRMKLEPLADGAQTKLSWTADVTDLKGLVATVSPGLVKAAADQVLQSGWAAVHAKLKTVG